MTASTTSVQPIGRFPRIHSSDTVYPLGSACLDDDTPATPSRPKYVRALATRNIYRYNLGLDENTPVCIDRVYKSGPDEGSEEPQTPQGDYAHCHDFRQNSSSEGLDLHYYSPATTLTCTRHYINFASPVINHNIDKAGMFSPTRLPSGHKPTLCTALSEVLEARGNPGPPVFPSIIQEWVIGPRGKTGGECMLEPFGFITVKAKLENYKRSKEYMLRRLRNRFAGMFRRGGPEPRELASEARR